MSAIIFGNEYVSLDSTITAIMAREMIEGVMFCVTHFGAVLKNELLSQEEKRRSLKVLIPSVTSGLSLGLLISIAIGISIVYAVGDHLDTEYGVEVGEGVSRLIAAVFVTDLTLKLPKWFKISNFAPEDDDKTTEKDMYGRRWEMGFSLFWNILRESIEGGTLTAVAVILSEESSSALGNSVGVAIAVTVLLALIFGFGAKHVSTRFFGILAAILAQILAMGLWTGSARAFEEVYAINLTGDDDEGTTKMIYNYEGTSYGDSLTVLEFLGFSYTLTALTLSVWLLALVLISFAQFWHNYLGKPFVPKSVTDKLAEQKDRWCSRCKKDNNVEDASNDTKG